MKNKPIHELISDERDRDIRLKANRNARIAESYVVAIVVIVSLICKQGFLGWLVLSIDCFSEIVEAVTKYYYYREKSYLRETALLLVLLLCSSFLAVSGIVQR